MNLYDVMVFANFNVCAFTKDGEQVTDVQENLLTLWAELAANHGFDVNGLKVDTTNGRWRLFKVTDGWNLERI